MPNIYILIIPLVIFGGILGWVLRKLFFDRKFVSINSFSSLQEEFKKLEIQRAVDENSLSSLSLEKENLFIALNQKTQEVNTLNGILGERTAQRDNYKIEHELIGKELQQIKEEKNSTFSQLTYLKELISELNAKLKFNEEKLQTQKVEIENLGKQFEHTFKVLAQDILEDKTKRFTENQEKSLKDILDPLEKEIKKFKDDVVEKQRQESDERISLREQVKNMTSLNQTLSEQANRLTETLRLQVKQQGDWGESILEAILENSGLQKGLQYFTQQSSKNEDGKTMRPDIIIRYPDDRAIVIDSKVSLVHYYEMCGCQEDSEQKNYLLQLILSVKSHIDNLASKSYQDINNVLDFIIMFVPVESAYIAAMHGEPELWQYAYKKGIFLISPANLITTLKLVKDMWRKDAVDRNAQEIADKAGKLYDKLVNFVDSFEDIGKKLEKTSDAWNDARKQLTAGKGNLISQALRMNALHINSKKELSDDLANQAILNDHFSIDEKPAEGLPLYE